MYIQKRGVLYIWCRSHVNIWINLTNLQALQLLSLSYFQGSVNTRYQWRKVKQQLLCCHLWNHCLVKGTQCGYTTSAVHPNRKDVPKIVKDESEERGNYSLAFRPNVYAEMMWQKKNKWHHNPNMSWWWNEKGENKMGGRKKKKTFHFRTTIQIW
jgi:hypothetical protein